MPLTIPTLDDRRYQDLLNEALGRIPVHNPEWTNFNESDPGVTLLELFAFLTENLLYRANQIPERNRRKFLSLLGIPLQPSVSAQALVTITNDRGPLQTISLNDDLEVRAGQVPFRTDHGLQVLPIDTQVYFKRQMLNPPANLVAYYNQLYASYRGYQVDTPPMLYETVPLSQKIINAGGVNLADTVDNALWIALLVRDADKQQVDAIDLARQAIAGQTISLGVIPVLNSASQQLLPVGQVASGTEARLQFAIPKIPVGGKLPDDVRYRVPQYTILDGNSPTDVMAQPGVVEMTLPGDVGQLTLWSNLDPLEAGVGDFPPTLADSTLNERLITWLRVSAPPASHVQLLWVAINSVSVTQRAYVANELLPDGTGSPDQSATLAKTPVIAGSVQLTVTPSIAGARPEQWQEIDDLLAAPPEVIVANSTLPPGTLPPPPASANVFSLDPEAGTIRFGDGAHGARPPYGAVLRASYAYSMGFGGNVGAGSINSGSALPPGLTVTNPVRAWGGADAETASDGEKQIARYLQHRDRLVSATDFETITLRTPGLAIGRVEVLSAYNPVLAPSAPGDAAGAVTLMVIPTYDQVHPDAPEPDNLFLQTIADYLEPRRLVTTEIFLRGPLYTDVWVSIGLKVVPGASVSQVRDDVKAAIANYLSPLPTSSGVLLDNQVDLIASPQYAQTQRGWPLRKPVIDLELLAVASRVSGVLLINQVLLGQGSGPGVSQIPITGLQLPHLAGMNVAVGDPMSLDQVRGQVAPGSAGGAGGAGGTGTTGGVGGQGGQDGQGGQGAPPTQPKLPPFAPLPITPDECG
jgi:hypothetical protein